MSAWFVLQNIGLGAGLSMDACAVSMSDGFCEPKMRTAKMIAIPAVFAFFQAAMPIAGYFLGHALIRYIAPFVPWIALALLTFLGVKTIVDGVRTKSGECKTAALSARAILLQAVATSIDALSVGLTIADYTISQAFIAAGIIAAVTFGLCCLALPIGKKFGDALGRKALILGGCILIAIGIEICITGLL